MNNRKVVPTATSSFSGSRFPVSPVLSAVEREPESKPVFPAMAIF